MTVSSASNPALRRIHQAALRLFAATGSTQISISELAQAAGVARGTVYNNLAAPENLFEEIANQLACEMHQRVLASFAQIDDPAQRMANGARFFIRRAHEEPDWGKFLCRFAFSTASMHETLNGTLAAQMLCGMQAGRFQFRAEQLPSVLGLVGGTVLSSMLLVREGLRTWRDAGSDCAELLLRALGVAPDEARALAQTELPPLAALE